MRSTLAHFLEKTCGLLRLDSPTEPETKTPLNLLLGSPINPAIRGGFRIAPNDSSPLALVIDGHVNLAADGLVIDRQLGSIGLIHFLHEKNTDAKHVTKLLEEAAHVRHLLGLKRLDGRGNPMTVQVPAIEIVFLVLAEDEPSPPLRNALRDSLRDNLQTSGLLHSISVNLGFLHKKPSAHNDNHAALGRAFCWLLPETRKWFAKKAKNSASTVKPKKWDRLKLTDFRRSGVRTWIKTEAQLHVIHGPNGSGKSTLAEGFTYAVTGCSPRIQLDQPDDTGKALQPLIHSSAKNATASICFGKKTKITCEVPSPKPGPRTGCPTPPGALTLDQMLCDRLATSTSQDRAALWLKTFFPERDTERRQRHGLKTKILGHLSLLLPAYEHNALPGLRDEVLRVATDGLAGKPVTVHDFLRLAMLREASFTPMSEEAGSIGLMLPDVLKTPLSINPDTPAGAIDLRDAAQRTELSKRLSTALKNDAPLLEKWRTHNTSALSGLLERLSMDVFADDASNRAGLGAADRAYSFNRWLSAVARADLLDRAHVIASTLETHLGDDPAELEDIRPRISSEEIRRRRDDAVQQRDASRQELSSINTSRGESASSRRMRRVGVSDLAPFTAALRAGYFEPQLKAAHANTITNLIAKRSSESVEGFTVGTPGWTAPLQELGRLRQRAAISFGPPLLAPEGRGRNAPLKFEARAQTIVELINDSIALANIEAGAAHQFLKELETGPFRTALLEFIALLTPARWAYDIQASLNLTDNSDAGNTSLELKSNGQDASKVLNTAELNTLSLAIHLLCAPRVPNPWQVVFLDDPLQNMDELTVVTVSRALARLMRLWKTGENGLEDWQIVLLLHGEDDCERILFECPAAYYRLRWLTPHSGSEKEPAAEPEEIKADLARSTINGEFLNLTNFLVEEPAVAITSTAS